MCALQSAHHDLVANQDAVAINRSKCLAAAPRPAILPMGDRSSPPVRVPAKLLAEQIEILRGIMGPDVSPAELRAFAREDLLRVFVLRLRYFRNQLMLFFVTAINKLCCAWLLKLCYVVWFACLFCVWPFVNALYISMVLSIDSFISQVLA